MPDRVVYFDADDVYEDCVYQRANGDGRHNVMSDDESAWVGEGGGGGGVVTRCADVSCVTASVLIGQTADRISVQWGVVESTPSITALTHHIVTHHTHTISDYTIQRTITWNSFRCLIQKSISRLHFVSEHKNNID